ncbi:MAG: ribbon-helix-helix domain-containing protein [Alphaproteobacteria bacterium]|nr:ribbon-helix-helix domain-containing protein [Alphaproteobacteria bacterium]
MNKISVLIAGRHATSISLEKEFVEALKEIAASRKKSINEIITQIDASRAEKNLSSAIRVYVLKTLQQK